jgi:hypothetical protein
MAAGNIKHTNSPIAEIIYIDKGTGTIAAGDVVAFDSSGNVIPATTSTLAPHGILTDLTHVVGATTYYGVCMRGYIVAVCGAAISPNKLVKTDSGLDVIAVTQTISSTYVQAEMQEFYKVVGRYVRLETDNQYNPSDGSATLLGIVSVGAGWN